MVAHPGVTDSRLVHLPCPARFLIISILSVLILPSAGQAQVPPPEQAGVTWDFETGDLRGWTVVPRTAELRAVAPPRQGNAFDGQPTLGDNLAARGDGRSNHQGEFWIGTFERYRGEPNLEPGNVQGDEPTGTLMSSRFLIPESTLSFLLGGTEGPDIQVELWIVGANVPIREPVLVAPGTGSETMRRVTWDLREFAGQVGVIRIVDESPFGHINVDDFVFAGPGLVVTVPDLSGRRPPEAAAILEPMALGLIVRGPILSPEARGTIAAQEPEPGTPVGRRTRVQVDTAAWGVIPNLMGMDTLRARRQLREEGFLLAEVVPRPSTLPQGRIVDQAPDPGTNQPPGTRVTVVVAVPEQRGDLPREEGPPTDLSPGQIQVPNLHGMKAAAADGRVQGVGLIPLREERFRWSFFETGTVIDQRPPPGALVEPASEVYLVVARRIPVGWIFPGVVLLSFAGGALVGRMGRKPDRPEGAPDGTPPPVRPDLEIHTQVPPGAQTYPAGGKPGISYELHWRMVPDTGKPSIEFGGPLMESEKIVKKAKKEGPSHV